MPMEHFFGARIDQMIDRSHPLVVLVRRTSWNEQETLLAAQIPKPKLSAQCSRRTGCPPTSDYRKVARSGDSRYAGSRPKLSPTIVVGMNQATIGSISIAGRRGVVRPSIVSTCVRLVPRGVGCGRRRAG